MVAGWPGAWARQGRAEKGGESGGFPASQSREQGGGVVPGRRRWGGVGRGARPPPTGGGQGGGIWDTRGAPRLVGSLDPGRAPPATTVPPPADERQEWHTATPITSPRAGRCHGLETQ